MAETDKAFTGSIPSLYDTLMVPLIFEAYATNLAGLVASLSPSSVLETAAGTGVVTRSLAPKLSAAADMATASKTPRPERCTTSSSAFDDLTIGIGWVGRFERAQ